ncbi:MULTISPECIES: RNA polymerase sigma factor [Pseudomonas]|jgi:RNA polymerase sigma-70 factor (ECF subfamily)|uniref:RNA polymerase sigma factor n=1 Tax=Pseudomonas TaxID=286 RepID=UPI00210D76F4|nr:MULTISPECIES: RNA polymerase sigma factor [Pseudomonas]MCU1738118.1 RNA polymerase sigma factor [Pseudomonas sp. 20S_6.2_Bac1]
MNLALRPPENPDAEGTELHTGRAHFLQVFLSQRSQMEALVSRRVGCRATAADLVQDLFLRFWRRPLVQVEELSTYLLRCAGNIAIDHLRSEGARVRVNEGWLPEQQDNQSLEPEAALAAGNDLRHVEAALRSLPERTRQIFLLNRIHGRKYAEIAKAMDLSQSAVEKHMMRALEACKASLREPSATYREPSAAYRAPSVTRLPGKAS